MTQPRSLTDRQREIFLNELRDTAPDVMIVSAVRQSRFFHEHVKELEQVPYGRELYKVPSRNEPGLGQKIDFVEVTASESVRGNVDPGKPAIGKIGSGTKEWILGELKLEARVPEHFGAKYAEHLKLLWSRGEIKFDGEKYYV